MRHEAGCLPDDFAQLLGKVHEFAEEVGRASEGLCYDVEVAQLAATDWVTLNFSCDKLFSRVLPHSTKCVPTRDLAITHCIVRFVAAAPVSVGDHVRCTRAPRDLDQQDPARLFIGPCWAREWVAYHVEWRIAPASGYLIDRFGQTVKQEWLYRHCLRLPIFHDTDNQDPPIIGERC